MADARYLPPRRGTMMVSMHPADIVHGVCQRQFLQSMTKEELEKIADAVNAELSTRGSTEHEHTVTGTDE